VRHCHYPLNNRDVIADNFPFQFIVRQCALEGNVLVDLLVMPRNITHTCKSNDATCIAYRRLALVLEHGLDVVSLNAMTSRSVPAPLTCCCMLMCRGCDLACNQSFDIDGSS